MSDDIVFDYAFASDLIELFIERFKEGSTDLPDSEELIWAVIELAKEASYHGEDRETNKLCMELTNAKGISYSTVISLIEPFRQRMMSMIEANRAKLGTSSIQPDSNDDAPF